MLAANTHQLIRDRAGKTRRLYERDPGDVPLRGQAKRQAFASYAGTVRYTYLESLSVPAHLVMLKRIGRDRKGRETGEYVRW